MSLGQQILDELGRREWRYGRFSYDQHQELKQVDSHSSLNTFLARHDFPTVTNDAMAPQVADALIDQWKIHDVKEVKSGLLFGLLSAPEGWILLLLLSPVLIVGYIMRVLFRLLNTRLKVK